MMMQPLASLEMGGHETAEENSTTARPQSIVNPLETSEPALSEDGHLSASDNEEGRTVEKIQFTSEDKSLVKGLTALSLDSTQPTAISEGTAKDIERAEEAGEICFQPAQYSLEDFEPHALGVEFGEEDLQEAFEFLAEDLGALEYLQDTVETDRFPEDEGLIAEPLVQEDSGLQDSTNTENFTDILDRDLNPELISALELLSEELFSRKGSKAQIPFEGPTDLVPTCLPCTDQPNSDSIVQENEGALSSLDNARTESFADSLEEKEELDPGLISALEPLIEEGSVLQDSTNTENFTDILDRDLNPELISALEVLSEELFSRKGSKAQVPFEGPTDLVPTCLPCTDQPNSDSIVQENEGALSSLDNARTGSFADSLEEKEELDPELISALQTLSVEKVFSRQDSVDPTALVRTCLPCPDKVSSNIIPQEKAELEITESSSLAGSAKISEHEEPLDSNFVKSLNLVAPTYMPDHSSSKTDTTILSRGSSIEEPELNIDFEAGDLEGLTLEELEILIGYSQNQMMSEGVEDEYESAYESGLDVPIVSDREKAHEEADVVIESFERKKDRQCIGHKEVVFGLSISDCGKFLATAGQDSTICVWNVEKNRLLATLKGHDIKHECLRVAWAPTNWGVSPSNGRNDTMALASAGADGKVKIWESTDSGKAWTCISTLDHCKNQNEKVQDDDNDDVNEEEGKEESEEQAQEEVPQIYALQFIKSWKGLPSFVQRTDEEKKNLSVLMTSSDDMLHLWQQCTDDEKSSLQKDEDIPEEAGNIVKLMDLKFTHLECGYGGTFVHINLGDSKPSDLLTKQSEGSNIISSKKAFGGERNPDNLVFVFDAQQCPANNLLGVALSDGTLRLINCRGVCVSILQLPGCESHLTAFSWDKAGTRLASCVASGHLILWSIRVTDQGNGRVHPSCQAVLDGGHSPGRPLFGALFCGREDEDLLLSWGVDGRLCLWDSFSEGLIGAPMHILVANEDYPIYCVDATSWKEETDVNKYIAHIAVGGGRESGFLGNPLYIYDIHHSKH